MLISRYCETDWARKSSRSGGWSPRRLRGGQLLGTWAGRLHSGECFLGGHLCLKKKAQLKKGEHVTSLNRNQEGGGCLVWHQANGFLVLSLAACPWRYCLPVGRTPPAASPVCLHVLCTCGWQESLHHDCFPVSLFSSSFSCAWNILGSVLISDLCFNSSSLQTPSLDARVLPFPYSNITCL